MRSILQAALAVEPPSLANDVRPSDVDAFRAGEEVVLAGGPYKGTSGIFVGLRADANWADITELNGHVRSHPVEWLSRSASVPPSSSKVLGQRT